MLCVQHVIPEFAMAVSVITSSAFASWHPFKLGSYLPQRQEIGAQKCYLN